MDRRGFLRNIAGSLAAFFLPIPAAKPLASKKLEMVEIGRHLGDGTRLEQTVGYDPDDPFSKIRFLIGPPRIWHPDKGFVSLDGLTDEGRRRIFDGKSPYVTLAKNDDAS